MGTLEDNLENNSYDIIVIGGGISGLGVTEAAAKAGYKVLLLEKELCYRATSDASLRIIHGGFRYLQHLNFPRVIESIRDQNLLLQRAPDKVKEIPCLMPLDGFGLKTKYPLKAALLFYSSLSKFLGSRKVSHGDVLSRDEVAKRVPLLEKHAPHGALLWYDAYMPEPHGLGDFIRREAEALGAEVREGSKVDQIIRNGAGFQTESIEDGKGVTYRGRVVVNTAGPWLHAFAKKIEGIKEDLPRYWCKGFNIILKKQIEKEYAIGISGNEDRLYFIVPRGTGTALGTFYIPYRGKVENVTVSEAELEEAISGFNEALPGASVSMDDIDSFEVGVLPSKREVKGEPVLYGSEKLRDYNGYIEVLSTKYTTFRSQAEKILKRAGTHLEK